MKRTVDTTPEIAQAFCTNCGVPIQTHRLVTLPNGALSLRKLSGRRRTHCETCQQNHKRASWYVAPSGVRRRAKAQGELLV